MRWILNEIQAYKIIISTQEDYCAWIAARSPAMVFLNAGCGHVKMCTDPNFDDFVDNVRRSTTKASKWAKKVLI
jgi:phenylalanine-4-hydroxylase